MTSLIAFRRKTQSVPSGPKRYDYVEETDGWYYSRDRTSIEDLLDQELSRTLGREVKLGVESISEKVED